MLYKKVRFCILLFFAGTIALLSSACSEQEKKLIVYAGKGLQAAIEEIVHSFEQSHEVNVNVVYGGSQTLLSVMQTTQKGDVFIPGSLISIEEAGDLVAYYKIIAQHRPVVAVRGDNLKGIVSFQDLTKPGIKVAIGNKKTCALGQITDRLLERTGNRHDFLKNVTLQGSTANELLDLVIQGEVDAAITHSHLLALSISQKLRKIDIPASFVESQEIPLGVLRFSENRKVADQFCVFVETEGQKIFKKHGFEG